MSNRNRNRNRQAFGAHSQKTQGAQASTAQSTEKTDQKIIDNRENVFSTQGYHFKPSNILLMALGAPKADKTGFSVQEMKFREALRQKVKAAENEICLEANEFQYLKILVKIVEYQIENPKLIEFIENF